jgi:hypothetical protein
MRWEVKEREDGKFGVYLCQEFWKFPDQEVCYTVSSNEKCAVSAVNRLNEAQESDGKQHTETTDNTLQDETEFICENDAHI